LLTAAIRRNSSTNVSVHNLLLKTFFTICLTCQTHGLICKFGKGNQTRFDETLRKYCVYYEEYSTDECNSEAEGKFGALSTIDEISGKCMAYRYPKGLDVVVACFCREDGCNALDTIIPLMRNSRQNPQILPSIPELWDVDPSFDAKKQHELMKCIAEKGLQREDRRSKLVFTREVAMLTAVLTIPVVLFCIFSSYLHIFGAAKKHKY
ncbi:hypothetical protein OESDEN_09696, partial [Oesophagostomum dentatum]